MYWVLVFVAGMVIPRVLPIHASMAHAVLQRWLHEEGVTARGHIDRLQRIIMDLPSDDEHGYLCVMVDNSIMAIAHLERREGTLALRALESSDPSAGGVLLYSLIATHENLTVSSTTLDPRWVLEYRYLR